MTNEADPVPAAPPCINVLLAEDHQTVREGLTLLIDSQADMRVVCALADGRDVVQQALALTPDVVVMDLSMPEMNGLAATRELKRSCPNTPVVVLTRHDDDAYVQELLSAGATGYVLKRSPSTALLAAVRAAAQGRGYLDGWLGARLANAMRKPPVAGWTRTAPASDRENQVLRLVARGHSNKEIAAQLGISVKTVEVHKANAIKKLGLHGRIDVVQYGLLQGWLQQD